MIMPWSACSLCPVYKYVSSVW